MGLLNISRVGKVLDSHIKEEYDYRKDTFNKVEGLNTRFEELEAELKNLKFDFEKRILAFHKEVSDKYFASMENFMSRQREISLIHTLAGQIKDQDLVKLQVALLQPIIENKNKQEKKEVSEKIDNIIASKGNKILEQRDTLHNEYLVRNRNKQDTRDIESKLAVLDWILNLKDEN